MTDMLFILLFVASVALNLFFAWYCRNLLVSLYDVSENMKVLTEEVVSFDAHLNSVHDLEVFYGDATLGALMQHSTALVNILEDFVEIYGLFGNEAEPALTEEVLDDANAETQET